MSLLVNVDFYAHRVYAQGLPEPPDGFDWEGFLSTACRVLVALNQRTDGAFTHLHVFDTETRV